MSLRTLSLAFLMQSVLLQTLLFSVCLVRSASVESTWLSALWCSTIETSPSDDAIAMKIFLENVGLLLTATASEDHELVRQGTIGDNRYIFAAYEPSKFLSIAESVPGFDFESITSVEGFNEITTNSKSGMKFFVSNDRRWMIKSASPDESRWLNDMFPAYHDHLVNTTRTPSLLNGLYGLFRVKCAGFSKSYFLMDNLFTSVELSMEFQYDLKGSTFGRDAKQSATLLDNDFRRVDQKIMLSPSTESLLTATLHRDLEFLKEHGRVDYSLLLGIHVPTGRTPARSFAKSLRYGRSEFKKERFDQRGIIYVNETDSTVGAVYVMRIIDFLQAFTGKRIVEHGVKSFLHGDNMTTIQPPDVYADRLFEFVQKSFVVNRSRKDRGI